MEFPPLSPQWKEHSLQRLTALIPSQIAFFVQLADFRAGGLPRTESVVATGWLDDQGRRDFHEWVLRPDMVETHPGLAGLMQITRRIYTRRRVELVDDKTWYCSEIVNTLFRHTRVDDNIGAVYRLDDDGTMMGWGLYRATGDRPFTERERTLVHLFLKATAPMYVREFRRQDHLRALPPRLRQTLDGLLEGDSEKQIAFKLGLSRHTVHEYVGDLYRRFNVSSRSELLVKVLRSYVPHMPDHQ